MRVALDATPLALSSGGLRRYVEQLSLALAREFPADSFVLMSGQPFEFVAAPFTENLSCAAHEPGLLARKWWFTGAPLATKRNNADLFHGTNFEVPLVRLRPSVMTIHDLSPWKNPEWHPRWIRPRSRTPWLLRLKRADAVITPTEAVRRDAIRHFALPPERVFAVPEAAAACFRSREWEAPTPNPYILFAGTVEPRKNLPLLIDAWREARKRVNVRLLIVGRTREDAPALQQEAGLELLGEVPDEQLAVLYAKAAAFVYPSHYEGFGLPVLEAMQCGAPVVISQDAALREVAGDAAIVVNSVGECAAAIEVLLSNTALAQQQRARGLRRASDFSWQRTAQMTRAVYEEAIDRFV